MDDGGGQKGPFIGPDDASPLERMGGKVFEAST